MECPCSNIKSPKVTNRLRALLRNFQSQFYGVWRAVDAKLQNLELRLSEKEGGEREECSLKESEPNGDDNGMLSSHYIAFMNTGVFFIMHVCMFRKIICWLLTRFE